MSKTRPKTKASAQEEITPEEKGAEVQKNELPASEPQKQPEEAPEEASTEEPAKVKKAAKAKFPAFLEGYIKSYPDEKAFHVTSDRQVFLDKDYNLAKLHQNSLGKGELKTYNI